MPATPSCSMSPTLIPVAVSIVPKPVTGRKRKQGDSAEAAARKAEQNRLAQKAFRERKDLKIKELEVKVAVLSQLNSNSGTSQQINNSSSSSNNAELLEKIALLESRVKLLESENCGLKEKLSSVCTAAAAKTSNATSTQRIPPQVPGYQLPLSHWATGILSIQSNNGMSHADSSAMQSQQHNFPSPVTSPKVLDSHHDSSSDAESTGTSVAYMRRGYFQTVV